MIVEVTLLLMSGVRERVIVVKWPLIVHDGGALEGHVVSFGHARQWVSRETGSRHETTKDCSRHSLPCLLRQDIRNRACPSVDCETKDRRRRRKY